MNSSKLYKMIIQNKFFEKCFTLCWKMIVQNPRMILVEGPSRGNTYDRTVFREFTSSGSKVFFTVWPALYLHEDGPLLIKGVVKVEWTFLCYEYCWLSVCYYSICNKVLDKNVKEYRFQVSHLICYKRMCYSCNDVLNMYVICQM